MVLSLVITIRILFLNELLHTKYLFKLIVVIIARCASIRIIFACSREGRIRDLNECIARVLIEVVLISAYEL